jgi:methylenetetrahydrofolate reductase (NADPH)
LKILPQVFKIDLPEELINEVENAKNNEAVKQIGIEWAITQCKEHWTSEFLFYTSTQWGKSDNIKK